MKNEFTTKEVGKILGATPQLVEDWINRGLITPDLQEGGGPGSKRLFSRDALHRAALAYSLKKDYKMPRKSILQTIKVCQAEIDWLISTVKIYADIGGPEDQPYAVSYIYDLDPSGKHDFETFIHLISIDEWVRGRISEVL
jgi:DNA-binding transcriptional MerR regulator